jgi:hypothetical protein
MDYTFRLSIIRCGKIKSSFKPYIGLHQLQRAQYLRRSYFFSRSKNSELPPLTQGGHSIRHTDDDSPTGSETVSL